MAKTAIFLSKPLGLTVTEGASVLGVTRQALSNLLNGTSGISPEMAIRHSKAFGSTPETWINLQAAFSLEQPQHCQPRHRQRRHLLGRRHLPRRNPHPLPTCVVLPISHVYLQSEATSDEAGHPDLVRADGPLPPGHRHAARPQFPTPISPLHYNKICEFCLPSVQPPLP